MKKNLILFVIFIFIIVTPVYVEDNINNEQNLTENKSVEEQEFDYVGKFCEGLALVKHR